MPWIDLSQSDFDLSPPIGVEKKDIPGVGSTLELLHLQTL